MPVSAGGRVPDRRLAATVRVGSVQDLTVVRRVAPKLVSHTIAEDFSGGEPWR